MKTLVAFQHMDWSFAEGEEVADDHPMIALAPHLFDLPEPDPAPAPDPDPRIRGPLVEPVKKTRSSKKEA